MVTLKPRCLSKSPRDEAVIPFPNEDTTPPVTKINLTFFREVISIFLFYKYRLRGVEKQFA
jgi:hypothetical protein